MPFDVWDEISQGPNVSLLINENVESADPRLDEEFQALSRLVLMERTFYFNTEIYHI